jgi:hypothetical protein
MTRIQAWLVGAAAAAAIAPWRATWGQAPPATVSGVVMDRSRSLPVHGARVALLGVGTAASTDSAGVFRLADLVPGIRVLQVRAVGYAVGSWLLQLGEGQRLSDTFDLEPLPVAVEPIDVVGAAGAGGFRSEAAFLERSRSGRGFFVTREQIRARQPARAADLLRAIPGVLTICGLRGCTVQMQRSTGLCRPEFYLDGHPATFSTGADFPIDVAAIRGLEVYRDQLEAPEPFHRPGLRCGVIAIWTIDPGENLDRRP